ncbi:MAG: aldo/keto reductase [Clostridia bacterium]|nr:aldo/keto reductase [Clostridia bacterium]
MQYVTLNNGVKMPQLGFGVYQIEKDECERCVLDAIETGYRHIDTAQAYNNEEEVGSAVIKSGIPRSEFFITSKIFVNNYGYEKAKKAIEISLERLKTDYIDLMLIHQPFGDYYGAWKAFEEMYEQGRLKAIGVSNFYPDRLVDLCCYSKIPPMVNQIETHPFNQQVEAQKWTEKYNVQIEAWAPFGQGRGEMFSNPAIAEIGKKYNKTVAQTILRWQLQRGIVVIPKSTHQERMKENFDVFDFELSAEDMAKMASLDKKQGFSQPPHNTPEAVEKFFRLSEARKNS